MPSPPKPKTSGGSGGLMILLIIGAAVALYVAQSRRAPRGGGNPLLGMPLPPLDLVGWLNVDRPLTSADLAGKVVLVDYWASWCRPCRAKMPQLIEYRNRFRDQGVLLLGFTPESAGELPNVTAYMQSVPGLDWPVGYGAQAIVEMMGVPGLPTYVLYDKSGQSVWAGVGSLVGLENATIAALARQPAGAP